MCVHRQTDNWFNMFVITEIEELQNHLFGGEKSLLTRILKRSTHRPLLLRFPLPVLSLSLFSAKSMELHAFVFSKSTQSNTIKTATGTNPLSPSLEEDS